MLPMFTDDACCMAAARENEMCHARPCFLIKAPSPLPLIKGTVAEPHKQLLACMSSHLFDCLRVFCSLFCHLRCLIYYLCPRLLEIPRCLNSSLPRAHPCTSARPRSRVGIMATDSTVGSGDDGTDSDGKTAQMIATNSSSASASTAQTSESTAQILVTNSSSASASTADRSCASRHGSVPDASRLNKHWGEPQCDCATPALASSLLDPR